MNCIKKSFSAPVARFLLLLTVAFGAPLALFAAPKDLGDLAKLFLDIFGIFVPVIIGLALLFFLWGVAKFISAAGNREARTEGKNFMIWGLVALFVIVAVWGLVQILLATFGIQPYVPFFPSPGSSGGTTGFGF